jgi:hypothetical protein
MSMPQRTPSEHGMTHWGPPAHQMQYPASLTQGGRNSWDYPYLNASATAGVVPSAAQPLQNTDLTADMSQLPADNTYDQYGERTTRV